MDENKWLIDKKIITKELINKILILVTITITVIIASIIAGIIISKSYNDKLIARYFSNMEEVEEDIEEIEEIKIPLPVYSDNAKNRMKDIYVSTTEEKVAYLTFDDGPSTNITPQVLQILENEGIKATFFVLGSRVELYPEIIKQTYEAGHYIANHGYSHDYAKVYASPNSVLDEYNLTEKIIKEAIGNKEYSSFLFRFPGGSENGKYAKIKKEAKRILEENNVAYINWNCLTNDAVGEPTKESIVNDLKSTAERKKQNSSINA